MPILSSFLSPQPSGSSLFVPPHPFCQYCSMDSVNWVPIHNPEGFSKHSLEEQFTLRYHRLPSELPQSEWEPGKVPLLRMEQALEHLLAMLCIGSGSCLEDCLGNQGKTCFKEARKQSPCSALSHWLLCERLVSPSRICSFSSCLFPSAQHSAV